MVTKIGNHPKHPRRIRISCLPSNQFLDLLLNHVATRMTIVLQTIIFYVNESLSHLSNEIENDKQAHCEARGNHLFSDLKEQGYYSFTLIFKIQARNFVKPVKITIY